MTPRALDRVRGVSMSMIFQDPMTSLNPYQRVGDQLAEGLIVHDGLSRREAAREAVRMLDRVRIPDAAQPGAALSARVLGRNAAAGDDRHGAAGQAEACCWPTSRPPRSM